MQIATGVMVEAYDGAQAVYEAVDARIIRGPALPWGDPTHDGNNTI